MMAAGMVTLTHRSGGPLMDIVVEEESSRNGFLASHDEVKVSRENHDFRISKDQLWKSLAMYSQNFLDNHQGLITICSKVPLPE